MDLDMQHMDGMKQPKRLSNNGHISVLIFTTFPRYEQAGESLRNGADGFLLKSMKRWS
ncbi:hypothetical protein CW304_11090 [Bacillus sp. UFRGS-B20]|nr:hypothetical protein CW304_11090 [Bacillus sp. UFRGS-B20]